ncbi:glycosyltransferase family 24 protein [Laetiporus sulphureus 93-53]|uniref:Glycosyltransferase family 24 protein n=1 Tax=Laetiporus sulphureus 93-53 TaxID=1314785 RepID=A0A165EGY0_9APHY|nr:glycosyltransferase family 24 protein [Laetiporus sulphureus 93-53]KZT07030.1 glycosyltransferase family 24 protein [Laetiporus sulphureus 93-53]
MRNVLRPFSWTALLLYAHVNLAASPPVQVELRSSWPAPPVPLECIETISIEDPGAFFPLVDALTNPETVPKPSSTSEALHRHALQTAIDEGYLSKPGEYASVEMNLALHVATPKIEAFYQYYTDLHAKRKEEAQGEGCGSWVDWYGEIVCDADTLSRLVSVEAIDPPKSSEVIPSYVRPRLLPFDHIQPSPAHTLDRPPHTAIFYASLSSSNFRELHQYLYATSSGLSPHIEYVFRPIPPEGRDISKRSYLSGYGVALDLKKMDYLALDDRRQATLEEEETSEEALASALAMDAISALLQQYPENTTLDASVPLTDDEFLEIGLQAAQLIHDAEDPLSTMKQLSQNFPKYATSLARRVTVDDNLSEEVENNQIRAPGGANVAWLNGVTLHERDLTPFALLRLLRKERDIMLSLTSLGLSPGKAFELLTHPSIAAAQSESDVLDGILDASDHLEGENVIVWLNDLQKDNRYGRWGSTLRLFLRQRYPGQIPNIRANIFNTVLAVDLSQSSSLHFIGSTVSQVIGRMFPFRWGVVPLVETEEGAKMARLLYYLNEHFGKSNAMEFVRHVAQIDKPVSTIKPTVDWSVVRQTFNLLLATNEPLEEGIVTDLDAILRGLPGSEDQLDKARAYAARLDAGLSSAPQGHAFVNGKHFDLDDEFLRLMQREANEQMEYITELVLTNVLTDNDLPSISTYFYDLPVASKRRNRHIYPSVKTGDLRILSLLELVGPYEFLNWPGSFVYPAEPERVPLTTYVVADLDSEAGRQLIKEALSATASGKHPSRLSFIHNPSNLSSEMSTQQTAVSSLLAQLATQELLHRMSPSRLLSALGFGDVAVQSESPQVVISSEGSLDDILGQTVLAEKDYQDYIRTGRLVARQLNLAPGERALILNGRVLGPIAAGEFSEDDFEILSAYESRKRVQPVADALEDLMDSLGEFDRPSYAEVIAVASSIISAIQLPDPSEVGLFNAPQEPRTRHYQLVEGNYTVFTLGDNTTSLFNFGIFVDPLSEAAQKWSSLIEWLMTIPGVSVEVHINPARYRELPLKRFYRYNLLPRLSFEENGEEVHALTEFDGLPIDPIYTLAMDVPQAWLVRPREALHDLDNILLSALPAHDRAQGVHAVFDLDHLVIEGHARDIRTNAPPRGLQLQLTSHVGTPIADTHVVANFGYLQFRTKPGVFHLEIRPGRGRKIFRMESVGNEGWHSPTVDAVGDEITLTSFEGLTLYPRFARLPGMERADVLAEAALPQVEDGGIIGQLKSWFSSLLPKKEETGVVATTSQQADINIFTVASGLLYERFASIMVLSVLSNTKSSVKFWFIENFLSPSFLEFLPHFAEAYGFQYELVTYKWPSWLRAQKEKQRIIWAYKILFLDVLFPMDLKKVIFVDADQIVRADLKELVDLDLHGAPYGYAPMGDDNEEMEGFRFWKTGYWKEFLRGLPYHISALYVVDLVRFRQMGAGDMLRGQYQQLSLDPNSLANLDQDLPNNLQREVPIFSLPEDWLWCETWCSKDRLDRAKTIDLCQNPLTKEPKLSRARQIPEWEQYDAEIAHFARRLAEEGKMRSEIVAADVNVLADVGARRSQIKASQPTDTTDHDEEVPRDEL